MKKARHILHIEHATEFGGSVRNLFLYLSHRKARDFTHYLWLVNTFDGAEVFNTCDVELFTTELNCVMNQRTNSKGVGAAAKSCMILGTHFFRIVRKARPDLIHFNNGPMLLNLPLLLLARLHGIPAVMHLRSAQAYPRFHRLIARLNRCFIANSSYIKNYYTKKQSLGKPIHVIYNGIETEGAHPVTQRRQLNECVILSLGRICQEKGFDLLLDAAAQLTFPYKIIIAGPVEDQDYTTVLKQKIEDLNQTSRVEILPFTDKIEGLLTSADMMVMPSRVPEGFGMTIIEAMRLGIPVIAPAYGGPVEIITDGENGFLVDPHDANALADKIKRLSQDHALCEYLVANGQKTVREKFSVSQTVTNSETLFTQSL